MLCVSMFNQKNSQESLTAWYIIKYHELNSSAYNKGLLKTIVHIKTTIINKNENKY
jgi:hypothetical protein